MKTLALFCALREHGCSSSTVANYANQENEGIYGDDSDSESEPDAGDEDESNTMHPPGASALVQCLCQSWRSCSDENQTCKGTLLLHQDQFYQHCIS